MANAVTGPRSTGARPTPEPCCVPSPTDDTDQLSRRLRVVLISTYELGHQPFGLASPAAWLRGAGCDVTCADLAVVALDEDAITGADLVGIYLPMHTATRLASRVVPRIRQLNPTVHICAYGLYAPINIEMLHQLSVDTILGGEFEEPMVELATRLTAGDTEPAVSAHRPALPVISLGRQRFLTPDRAGLPPLSSYATLHVPDGRQRTVGYTESTRGCKHLCRHCPIVPVYNGRFRVVQQDVALEDIDRQVEAGAEHITFGDPDFFNGPRHAVDLVEELHRRHPDLTYDVTIKVQHLVDHADLLPVLRRTGCELVTSAVESFDQRVLEVFDKHHTREDFETAVRLLHAAGIAFNPTFVAFTPWTTRQTYLDFLGTIRDLGLVGNVSPVQYAIRLLITQRSRLLEVPGIDSFLRDFDSEGLCYRWVHPDPLMDDLQDRIFDSVEAAVAADLPRSAVFGRVCDLVVDLMGDDADALITGPVPAVGQIVPFLSEPWYCCAEPVRRQLEPLL